ncbi:MAG: DegT/DnrJ/EryC1/StrS family aminotransferase [Acidiferrobacteraceae bacterium]
MKRDRRADDFMPFSRPSIGPEEIREVTACLESGWITTGPRAQRFEQALADYFGAPHVLALSSATAGLHLALLALDLKDGDEVITTPLTFTATLNTIVLAGGRPVLADIEPGSLNLDPGKVERAITSRTRAIVPVHFAGRPVDLDAFYHLADRHGLRIVEDAAQAVGAEYRGRRLGAFGDLQVFSFHPNKNITTGEGGCVVTRDAAVAKTVATLRFHGIDREAFSRHAKGGSPHYAVVAPGFKYNMMDIQAALGIHQLPRLDGFNRRRQALAERYQNLLHGWPQWTLPQPSPYPHRHAWNLYTPLINPASAGMDRDQFMRSMADAGIGTGLHYQAIHLHPFYMQRFGFRPGDFPIAESASDRIVSLPLFPDMTDADQDRVVDVMERLFRS